MPSYQIHNDVGKKLFKEKTLEAAVESIHEGCIDMNERFSIYENDRVHLFKGSVYALGRWYERYLQLREGRQQPLEIEIMRESERLHEVAQRDGWPGEWYRGDIRPREDYLFAKWSNLDNGGQHTVVWKVPRIGKDTVLHHFTHIAMTDQVPEGLDDQEAGPTRFMVPYDWAKGSIMLLLCDKIKVERDASGYRIKPSYTSF